MKLEKGNKFVMIGDSITDCGRARPVGEGLGGALGQGYVSLAAALLGAAYPSLSPRIVNMGTSGHNVRDLKARWQTDVLDLRPDWVSVCIGINDVWRQFDMPAQPESHVYLDEYERTLDELVEQTTPDVRGVVLMTPYYMEPSRKDAMRAMMDRYGAVVKKLAKRHRAVFVDTQAAFDAALKFYYPATLGWDRVHPNATGHMILARALLSALGFEW